MNNYLFFRGIPPLVENITIKEEFMKKIFKKIILLGVIFLFGLKGVKAESVFVSQQFIDNVWSFHYRNGSVWTFGNLPYNYANGKLVYCIQPDARITTNNYYVYDRFTMSGYSEEDKRKMELYAELNDTIKEKLEEILDEYFKENDIEKKIKKLKLLIDKKDNKKDNE